MMYMRVNLCISQNINEWANLGEEYMNGQHTFRATFISV